MRAWDEARGAVVGPKLVDHQDEAEDGQSGESAPNVDVKPPGLAVCGRSVRPRNGLELKGRPMTRQHASNSGGNT